MSASRTVVWKITNATNEALVLSQKVINHGVIKDELPSEIAAGDTLTVNAESDGFMTGTEGTITYSGKSGDFIFYFDNPYIGSDDYSVTLPVNYDKISHAESGNDYVITTRIFEKKAKSPVSK